MVEKLNSRLHPVEEVIANNHLLSKGLMLSKETVDIEQLA